MRESHYRASFRVTPRFHKRDDASGLCPRCGLRGAHVSWSDCIRQLREELANLEIEIVKLRPTRPYQRKYGRVAVSRFPTACGNNRIPV